MTKVMLVEDDNNLREIYEARLQAEGYDIVAAKDGEEALVMAKEHKPELVISDVMMPKISGFEMLDILRNTDGLKDVKVIMLTALGQSDDQARADKLGADRYLVKSQVTLEDIVTVARELIEGDGAPEAPTVAPTTDSPAAAADSTLAAAPAEPIAVAAEPVATAPGPVPEPAEPATAVITAEPLVVAAEPPTTDSPAAAADSTLATSDNTATAQSTAQEEASVEAKIEDFVASASSESAPAADSTPEQPASVVDTLEAHDNIKAEPEAGAVVFEPVAPKTEEPTAEAPVPTGTTATATDDKLMADAVDALMANTEANIKPVLHSENAVAEPAIVTEKTPEPATEEREKTAAELGSVPISGKKIISPVAGGSTKPSIEVLLAEEEAKNIQAGAEVPPAVPATPASVVTPGSVDPNSIAL